MGTPSQNSTTPSKTSFPIILCLDSLALTVSHVSPVSHLPCLLTLYKSGSVCNSLRCLVCVIAAILSFVPCFFRVLVPGPVTLTVFWINPLSAFC